MNADVHDIHHDGAKPTIFWKDLTGEKYDETFDAIVVSAGVADVRRKSDSACGLHSSSVQSWQFWRLLLPDLASESWLLVPASAPWQLFALANLCVSAVRIPCHVGVDALRNDRGSLLHAGFVVQQLF